MLPHKWLEIYNKSTALPFQNHLQLLIIINKTMKSDSRLNWSFDSSIRYSGLSRHLLSSSRRLSRSYRRELLLFVSSPSSSSRQLPRSTRREFLLLDSSIPSSSRRLLRPPHYASLHLRLVKCRVRLVDP